MTESHGPCQTRIDHLHYDGVSGHVKKENEPIFLRWQWNGSASLPAPAGLQSIGLPFLAGEHHNRRPRSFEIIGRMDRNTQQPMPETVSRILKRSGSIGRLPYPFPIDRGCNVPLPVCRNDALSSRRSASSCAGVGTYRSARRGRHVCPDLARTESSHFRRFSEIHRSREIMGSLEF